MRIVVLSSIVAALPSELVPLSLAHCAEWNEEVRRLMGSEIINAVTIYEMNGIKYTGAQKIYITSHPRFLSFVKLSIDNQEYSLGGDDLMRAVDYAMGRPVLPADEALLGDVFSVATKLKDESAAAARDETLEGPPR